jgi:phosphatidylglycerophosphatase A
VNRFYLTVATGFGAGYLRPAPGTWGTLPGIPLYLLFTQMTPLGYLLATTALFFVGVKAAGFAEQHFGKVDDGHIVIDEIVGYLVTMFLVPITFWNVVWGFFLFRFFDVVKPWPARGIDQAQAGGMGVMADDVAAGVYACVTLQLFCLFGWLGCGWS